MIKTILPLKSFAAVLVLVAASTSTPASAASMSDLKWAVSGPLTLIEGEAFWGAYVNGMIRINNDFSLGGESGFRFWSGPSSTSAWSIPILPTGYYHFNLASAPSLRPFVGAGMGFTISHASTSSATLGGGSNTEVDFEFQAHAGTRFNGDGPGFLVDLRLGFVDGSFLFGPTVGYAF